MFHEFVQLKRELQILYMSLMNTTIDISKDIDEFEKKLLYMFPNELESIYKIVNECKIILLSVLIKQKLI